MPTNPSERKTLIETARWYMLVAIAAGRPYSVVEMTLWLTLKSSDLELTRHEVREEMDYLRVRGLIQIEDEHTEHWRAKLTRLGIDLIEYTITCDPGIARPVRRI